VNNGWPHSIQPLLKDFPENSVAIVMSVRDNLKFFKLAFHSIMSFTSHPFHFVIIDNLGSFPTKNYLKRLQKNHPIHVIQYPNEFNFAAQLNLGFNYSFTFSQIKYGLAIHSDAVVEPNWINKLLHALARESAGGCVGPETGDHYLLFKREVFHKLSGFDEKYGGHSLVLRDFAARSEREGWKLITDTDTDIHHFYQTQMREGIITTNHYEDDKKLFFSKFKQEANNESIRPK